MIFRGFLLSADCSHALQQRWWMVQKFCTSNKLVVLIKLKAARLFQEFGVFVTHFKLSYILIMPQAFWRTPQKPFRQVHCIIHFTELRKIYTFFECLHEEVTANLFFILGFPETSYWLLNSSDDSLTIVEQSIKYLSLLTKQPDRRGSFWWSRVQRSWSVMLRYTHVFLLFIYKTVNEFLQTFE